MNKIARALAATAAATALMLGGASAASANSTNTVDRTEFDSIKLGHSLTHVRNVFDSQGKTTYKSNDLLDVEFRSAYTGDMDVEITFERSGGAWKVWRKWAWWASTPNQSHDPSSVSERKKIKNGMTISQVQTIIGSPGTRKLDYYSKYTQSREIFWPVAGHDSWSDYTVEFEKIGGVYKAVDRTTYIAY